LELDLIMGRKPPPTHQPRTFKALQGNIGSRFSACNLILTQLDGKFKNNTNWGARDNFGGEIRVTLKQK
jgi:hypothetical protein